MTNQEAIKMLTSKVECIRRETSGTDIDCNFHNCDDCELCYAQGTTGEQRKALNMAISALQEKELSETQNALDTISRQAAIEELKKISFSHWFECGEYLSEDTREIKIINSNKALEAIKALPSAQPERKKGHWINGNYHIRCSECGEDYPYQLRNFCPNCGADMRGEQGG